MNSFCYKSPKNLHHYTAWMCLPGWFWKSYLSLISLSFLLNSQYGLYPRIQRNGYDKIKWYFLSAVIHISLEPYLLSLFFRFSSFLSNFLLSADVWPWCMAFGLSFINFLRECISPARSVMPTV